MRNHQLESRMREIRLSGSEGGGAGQPALPTPITRTGVGVEVQVQVQLVHGGAGGIDRAPSGLPLA